MNIWKFIADSLTNSGKVVLMLVVDSNGSSPGRQGFKMAVNSSYDMNGSIGGGFMEHKLIELCKSKMNAPFVPFCKKQVHSKEASKNQSGMICSGEQTIAFYYLDKVNTSVISSIVKTKGHVVFDQVGISVYSKVLSAQFVFKKNEDKWLFSEQLDFVNRAYIVGGGHVSLALSIILDFLGFEVIVCDNREGLNTMTSNAFAKEVCVIDYNDIHKFIPDGDNVYVIIMSFGYRTDDIIIRKLLGRNFKYLGMLGSQHKIAEMFLALERDGFSEGDIQKVRSPVGLQIGSRTPEEISISIVAEIIKVKNEPK
jgi:xanthine dehydrogenase accessory factor